MGNWICYGQTEVRNNQKLVNPDTNLDLEGSVKLPFYLGDETLTITSQGIEGNAKGISALFVFLGPVRGEDINSRSLASVACGGGSENMSYDGLEWVIKGPRQINVCLMNNSGLKAVHGWYVQGEIE